MSVNSHYAVNCKRREEAISQSQCIILSLVLDIFYFFLRGTGKKKQFLFSFCIFYGSKSVLFLPLWEILGRSGTSLFSKLNLRSNLLSHNHFFFFWQPLTLPKKEKLLPFPTKKYGHLIVKQDFSHFQAPNLIKSN